MKKKFGLFKVLIILLLMVVVATCFIKGRSGEYEYVALADLFFNFVQSFYYFFDTALFILVLGGFYGLLNRIPGYKKLVLSIVDKVSNNSKRFLIIMTVVFAIFAAFTGFNMILLLFIPFVISIILLLGYDKLVALSVTLGGSFVGLMGGVFVTLKDSSNQYSSSYVTFEKLVGLDKNWQVSTTLPKVLLLIVGVVLLALYILSYIKNGKDNKYALTSSDALFVQTKDKDGKKIKTVDSKVKVWPVVLVFCIMTVLLVLGYLPWNNLFGIDCFDKFHSWLTGLSIEKYEVFNNLISKNITAFGHWNDLGSFMMVLLLMCFFGWILQIIYRVKFDDAMDGFIYGMKKMIFPALIAMLAYSVLVSSYNNGFVGTLITDVTKRFGDNVVVHSLLTILGSVLNVDLFYASSGVFGSIVTELTDKANLSVYAVMFQSLYGLVQFVGPTSLCLIVGLSYLEVPYKTWLGYIWRFIVELFIAVFVILMIVSLL